MIENFRDYKFRAGRLANKRAREISLVQLNWAINFNQDYIRTYSDPKAKIRAFPNGKLVTVGTLEPELVRRRLALASEALEVCLAERAHRQEEKELERQVDRTTDSNPLPDNHLLNLARAAAYRGVLRRLEETEGELIRLQRYLKDTRAALQGIIESEGMPIQ